MCESEDMQSILQHVQQLGCAWSQASQGQGHVEAAHLESSGMSWKLPFLGAVGSIEEQGIRIPPLSANCCFQDEYEVPIMHHSPLFPLASPLAFAHHVPSQPS